MMIPQKPWQLSQILDPKWPESIADSLRDLSSPHNQPFLSGIEL